jgi:CheY-like chemotaxis protein
MNNVPDKYILYAEDDIDDQELLCEMIQQIDHKLEIITVPNGLKLINFLESLTPGVKFPCFIILDINMPTLDGLKTLEILKCEESYKNIPVIMFSTSNLQKDIDDAIRLGAKEFITKPVEHAQIENVTQKFAEYCHSVPLLIR